MSPPTSNLAHHTTPTHDIAASLRLPRPNALPQTYHRSRIKADLPQVTLRATLAGLAIGSIVLISNFQFGLQTGWVSMMSLPSALLAFALFRVLPCARPFSDVENVYVQSLAVATGTGPLAFGLIGIVPAMEKLMTRSESGLNRVLSFSLPELVVWSLGLSLFGVFFSIPLRHQVIVKEKLPFPSGSATATLIAVLHGTRLDAAELDENVLLPHHATPRLSDSLLESGLDTGSDPASASTLDTGSGPTPTPESDTAPLPGSNSPLAPHLDDPTSHASKMRSLFATFAVSASYTLAAFFFPVLKRIPVFGHRASSVYHWDLQPSPAYIGQGIIMGLPTVLYMLFGALLGWAVLAPLAHHYKWAPGPVDDYASGGQGWVLWISLSAMISDSLVLFAVVVCKSLWSRKSSYAPLGQQQTAPLPRVPARHLISNNTTLLGIAVLSLVCVMLLRTVFGPILPLYSLLVAIFLAMAFSIFGVRALGETDLNPVSGIGKLSQLVFALLIPRDHPAKILINLVAGAVAEAGAQQAGDLMQDLKTGHLLGASPRAQFIAQVVGTLYSVVLSSSMYRIYNKVYTIPSDTFRVPTASIWIDCARLFSGAGLPPHALQFAVVCGLVFGAVLLAKNLVPCSWRVHRYLVYLPNGVAVGIGMYNAPSFTLARFVGGLIAYFWLRNVEKSHNAAKTAMIIFSSGLVLGEGLLSVVTMLLTTLKVRHY